MARRAMIAMIVLSCTSSTGCRQRSSNTEASTTASTTSSAPPSAPSAPDARPEAPATSPSAPEPFTVTSVDGLPADLATAQPLWESARPPGRQGPRVTRLYADGRLYTYSDTKRALADDKPTRTPAPLAWRLDARVDPAAVARIQALVRDRFATAAIPSPALGPDGLAMTWRGWVDGKETVAVTAAGATTSLPAPIAAIEQAIQEGIVPGAVPTYP